MGLLTLLSVLAGVISWAWTGCSVPTSQIPLFHSSSGGASRNITAKLFYELEELSRIVDVSYCVGTTGIQKPFLCASRCQDFEGFELVSTWNTGPLLADSCGYIAISHPPSPPRIIVAFRGTYSLANTIIDLSTVPQEYIPYPGSDGDDTSDILDTGQHPSYLRRSANFATSKCNDCTVHAGFMTSWKHTRPHVTPHIEELVRLYPEYQLSLVGHSLGGAVAALASLDYKSRGWNPQVTTFGEPRIGNLALMHYMDRAFVNEDAKDPESMYRRVTHIDDPVPLLPLKEWGYRMHAGEIFISRPDLSPSVADLKYCIGDEDPNCIAAADSSYSQSFNGELGAGELADRELREWWNASKSEWAVPSRYRIRQLFFAHRDYFWRLGLCLPGGDPTDWYRKYPPLDDRTE